MSQEDGMKFEQYIFLILDWFLLEYNTDSSVVLPVDSYYAASVMLKLNSEWKPILSQG